MTQRAILTILLTPILAILLWGCENDTGNDVAGPGGDPGGGTGGTCLGCHSSEDALKEALGTEELVVTTGTKDDG